MHHWQHLDKYLIMMCILFNSCDVERDEEKERERKESLREDNFVTE